MGENSVYVIFNDVETAKRNFISNMATWGTNLNVSISSALEWYIDEALEMVTEILDAFPNNHDAVTLKLLNDNVTYNIAPWIPKLLRNGKVRLLGLSDCVLFFLSEATIPKTAQAEPSYVCCHLRHVPRP